MARDLSGTSEDGTMAFMSVGKSEPVEGTDENVAELLSRVLPQWSEYQAGAQAVPILIDVRDPAVRETRETTPGLRRRHRADCATVKKFSSIR